MKNKIVTYIKDKTSKEEVQKLYEDLLKTSEIQEGDIVQLKSQNSPTMIIINNNVNTQVNYDTGINRLILRHECKFWNKGRAEFTTVILPTEALIKVQE